MEFFQFKDPEMGRGLICVAPNSAACSVFDERTFVKTFGGYCLYTDTKTDQIYIGVHRKRLVSRFRRMMREGGIDFQVRLHLPATFKQGSSKGRTLDWVAAKMV
jgi:hypothetical protein